MEVLLLYFYVQVHGPVVKRLVVYTNLNAKSIELVDHEAWGVQKNESTKNTG